MKSSSALRAQVEAALEKRVPAPFAWRERALPETLLTGIAALDQLTGGLPRGALVEVCGPSSSGRTTLLLAALAAATRAGEACALVDAGDAFDPAWAAAAGIDLKRLLWVRCGSSLTQSTRRAQREKQIPRPPRRARDDNPKNDKFKKDDDFARLEQALKATDLILQAGGFGLVALDVADLVPQVARRTPLASWFRFRRALEGTSAILLLLEQEPAENEIPPGEGARWTPIAGSSAALALRLRRVSAPPAGPGPSHARLLEGCEIQLEVLRAGERKPAQGVPRFAARTSWGRMNFERRARGERRGICDL